MLIYEKNNKLNINFENELDNPDIEIGKGEINVDGSNIVNGGGNSGGVFIVHNNVNILDKSFEEIATASQNNIVYLYISDGAATNIYWLTTILDSDKGHDLIFFNVSDVYNTNLRGSILTYSASDPSHYPTIVYG